MSIWTTIFVEKEWFSHTEFEFCPIPGDIITVWTGEKEAIALVVNHRVIKDKMLNSCIQLFCNKI
jgi:hypothetical protein